MSTKSQMKKTTDLITGTIGLSVASAAAAPLPGLAGTIVRGGALPMAGMGLLVEAAPRGSYGGTRRHKHKKSHSRKRHALF